LTEGVERGWVHTQNDRGETKHLPHKHNSFFHLSSGEINKEKKRKEKI
jgi:hypothetical protein